MTGKIIYNAIFHSQLRAGHEAAKLARAGEIDLDALTCVFRDSADSVGGPFFMAAMPGDAMSDPTERKRRQALCAIINKDLDAGLELGRSIGASLPLMEMVRARTYETAGTRAPAQGE